MNISQIKNNNKLKIKETHDRNHIPGFSIQSVGISILQLHFTISSPWLLFNVSRLQELEYSHCGQGKLTQLI